MVDVASMMAEMRRCVRPAPLARKMGPIPPTPDGPKTADGSDDKKMLVKPADPQNTTIEDLIATLPLGLTPAQDANGIIHDQSTLVARCALKHMHKYPLSSLSGAKCPTCVGRYKFASVIRARAEALYGSPFVIKPQGENKNVKDNIVEYANARFRVHLICHRATGDDSCVRAGEWLEITIYKTTAATRIDNVLRRADPDLIGDGKLPAAGKKFSRNWPIDPAMADERASRAVDPMSARSKMRISKAGTLCFENCRLG